MNETINDRITWFTDLPALRRGAFRTLDLLQSEPNTAVQYLGPAVAFVAMAETLGRDPHEDIVRIRRMMADINGPFSEQINAIKDYTKGELLDRPQINGGRP